MAVKFTFINLRIACFCLLSASLALVTASNEDRRVAYACEGHELSINCEEATLIHLIRANYGRFSIHTCNDQGHLNWSVNCASPKSMSVISERCSLKSQCSLKVLDGAFGDDPCPGTRKYLEVQYRCVSKHSKIGALSETNSNTQRNLSKSPFAFSTTNPLESRLKSESPQFVLHLATRQPIITSLQPFNTNFTKPNLSPPSVTLKSTPKNVLRNNFITNEDLKNNNTRSGGNSLTTSAKVAASVPESTTAAKAISSVRTTLSPKLSSITSLPFSSTASTHLSTVPVENNQNAQQIHLPTSSEATFSEPDCDQRDGWNGHQKGNCTSAWADRLRNRIEQGDSVISAANELAKRSRAYSLRGDDIAEVMVLAAEVVAQADHTVRQIGDQLQRYIVAKQFTQAVIEMTSNLLEPEARYEWAQLNGTAQREVASGVVSAMEGAGRLMASSMDGDFSKAYTNAFISVRSLQDGSGGSGVAHFPVEKDVVGSSWMTMEERVSIILTGHREHVFVFSAFRGLQAFLNPTLNNSLINSRVLSLSEYDIDGEANFNTNSIKIQFKHLRSDNVTNPRCVYWYSQTREWMNLGCSILFHNFTHTICECNQLGHYALLMDAASPKVAKTSSFYSLNVLLSLTAFVIIVILLMTFVILFFVKFKSDQHHIQQNIILNVIILEVLFLLQFTQASSISMLCNVTSVLMFYFLSSLFIWIFWETFRVFHELIKEKWRKKTHIYYYVAYGTPLLLAIIAVFVLNENAPLHSQCSFQHHSNQIIIFIAFLPSLIAIIGCFFFVILSLVQFLRKQNLSLHSTKANKDFQCRNSHVNIRSSLVSVTSMFILQLTNWLLALFALMFPSSFVLFHLFNCVNIVQSLQLFICDCAQNVEVRKSIAASAWFPKCMRTLLTKNKDITTSGQTNLFSIASNSYLASSPDTVINFNDDYYRKVASNSETHQLSCASLQKKLPRQSVSCYSPYLGSKAKTRAKTIHKINNSNSSRDTFKLGSPAYGLETASLQLQPDVVYGQQSVDPRRSSKYGAVKYGCQIAPLINDSSIRAPFPDHIYERIESEYSFGSSRSISHLPEQIVDRFEPPARVNTPGSFLTMEQTSQSPAFYSASSRLRGVDMRNLTTTSHKNAPYQVSQIACDRFYPVIDNNSGNMNRTCNQNSSSFDATPAEYASSENDSRTSSQSHNHPHSQSHSCHSGEALAQPPQLSREELRLAFNAKESILI